MVKLILFIPAILLGANALAQQLPLICQLEWDITNKAGSVVYAINAKCDHYAEGYIRPLSKLLSVNALVLRGGNKKEYILDATGFSAEDVFLNTKRGFLARMREELSTQNEDAINVIMYFSHVTLPADTPIYADENLKHRF